jgi:hypothetical protein
MIQIVPIDAWLYLSLSGRGKPSLGRKLSSTWRLASCLEGLARTSGNGVFRFVR